jgi:excisionase family DNA binding protein
MSDTVAGVARSLGCSQKAVRRLIAAGEIDADRVGRAIRVRRTAVDDYLERHRVTVLRKAEPT